MSHYTPQETLDFATLIEFAFVSFYMVELCMKLVVHRTYFFTNVDSRFNIFDLALVLTSSVELVGTLVVQTTSVNLSFLRVMRLLRIVKILRLFRLLRFFHDLRLMMDCMMGSIVSLTWAVVMVGCILYIFAIVILQLITVHFKDPNLRATLAPDDRADILLRFNSVSAALLTLFQAIPNLNMVSSMRHISMMLFESRHT